VFGNKAAKVWGKYDTVLCDLDGVIYEGSHAIVDAPETINTFIASGIPVGYVTNNSSRTPETIADQLAGFGIETLPTNVIGSAKTGVEILSTMIPAGAKVLVVGGEGLRSRVVEAGFELVKSSDDQPAGVIQGFDPSVAWTDLAEASYSIANGAKWVATNQDWTIPREKGIAPGNGTLVSAVHTAVGQLPIVAGKPEPAIFETAVRHFNAQRPLFVGDRIDTDITGANRAGMASALVLTGVSTRKEVLGVKPEGRPNFILGNMMELVEGYEAPVVDGSRFMCLEAVVELKGTVLRVVSGDPKGIGALRAACAAVYSSSTPIYGLEIPAELYE
jgi:HAD superfamily hydrolase (TIGR01450 family)